MKNRELTNRKNFMRELTMLKDALKNCKQATDPVRVR